jgi:hypothetical protein
MLAAASLLVAVSRAEPRSQSKIVFQAEADLPIEGWRVCEDLGFGPVPGVPDLRQRFRLCHPAGWVIRTFCRDPELVPPPLGRRCIRIGTETFDCGGNFQLLRFYRFDQTPVPTPTPVGTGTPTATASSTATSSATATVTASATATATATSTASATPTPSTTATVQTVFDTATPTRRARPQATRVRPGGIGFLQQIAGWLSLPASTPAPFQAERPTQTPLMPLHAQAAPTTSPQPSLALDFYGIDFTDTKHWVRIVIYPTTRRLNQGKPIVLKFLPGKACVFGDNHACVNRYLTPDGQTTTFLSVHSGVGGEGQAFRHALEGTGVDQAGLTLKKVQANLRQVEGAEVVISQGKRRIAGFTLQVVERIPASRLKAYYQAPVDQALAQASTHAPELLPFLLPGQPLLVFETCGWRIPAEKGAQKVPSTSASVYIGLIIKSSPNP